MLQNNIQNQIEGQVLISKVNKASEEDEPEQRSELPKLTLNPRKQSQNKQMKAKIRRSMTYGNDALAITEESLSPISESDDEVAKGHGFTERISNYEDMSASMITRAQTSTSQSKQLQPQQNN